MGCLLRKNFAPPQKAVPSSAIDIQKDTQDSGVANEPSIDEPEAKAGSSVATLWLKVNQENQPPASIPSTLLPAENCPRCRHVLAPPLKSSGRQVCVKCGWSDKPRREAAGSVAVNEQSDTDLLHLLEQAASESLENMKPRKKRN